MSTQYSSDEPTWPLLDKAVSESSPGLLVQALGAGSRHPALDHPVRYLPAGPDTSLCRRAVTAHGLALWNFFAATQSRQADALLQVENATEVCRVFIREQAPLFSAAPGTGLEDDPGFGLQLFVRREWPPAFGCVVESLFHEYAAAGYFDFEAIVQPEDCGFIGGLLPFDAAIKLGNAPAAAAAVRAGCRVDGVAMDSMGRSMDLIAYIMKTAKFKAAETAASVAAALMDRAVGASVSAAASPQQSPNRRRRASV